MTRSRLAWLGVVAVSLSAGTTLALPPAGDPGGSLSLEARVRYRRAIEEVTWRHRIWPPDNAGSKPSLDQILPASVLTARASDDVAKSRALEVVWQRALSAAELQAELDRMARDSRQPAVLRELFTALDNDPAVIAECLVRPILADRRIRELYGHDQRFHGALHEQVESERARLGSPPNLRALSGEVIEEELIRLDEESAAGRAVSDATRLRVVLDDAAFAARIKALRGMLGLAEETGAPASGGTPAAAPALPVGVGALQEDETHFYFIVVRDTSVDAVRVAYASYAKRPFEEWWREARKQIDTPVEAPAEASGGAASEPFAYRLPELADGACSGDTWSPTSKVKEPADRNDFTAVWTGSEMIVWGGQGGYYFSDGARYAPATDTWVAIGSGGTGPRKSHSAVWTGTEMIVWGGKNYYDHLADGGRYNPTTGTWTATNKTGAPCPRISHTAVWTGTEMIVWGGNLASSCTGQAGGRYNPTTDNWLPTSESGAPVNRTLSNGVWTGSELVVWGGYDDKSYKRLDTGGRYRPASDSWASVSGQNAPSARSAHSLVWTGSEVIVWGGYSGGYLSTGARYSPASDSWHAMAAATGVGASEADRAVWTGKELLVWQSGGGGRYDPSVDKWAPLSSIGGPTHWSDPIALPIGDEVLFWGGDISWSPAQGQGARYCLPPALSVASSDLSLEARANPDPGRLNSDLTWTITVRNSGPDVASAVSLVDTLPVGPTFLAAQTNQGTCTRSAGKVTCALGSIPSGGTVQVAIVVRPILQGNATNSAEVSAVNADPNPGNNKVTTTTNVGAASTLSRYLVPAVAHVSGAGGTQWRTDVAAVNRAGAPAQITLNFYSTAETMTRSASLASAAATEWGNILETVFGLSPATGASGSLEIVSTTPLFVTSRTYNQAASGTYGQYYPALTEADALTFGIQASLPQLKRNAAYRTNVGAINLWSGQATIAITLYDSKGAQVGSVKTITVDPQQYRQANDIFAGTGDQDIAYASVALQTPGARVWVCASVIDNATGDPTTIPMLLPASSSSSAPANEQGETSSGSRSLVNALDGPEPDPQEWPPFWDEPRAESYSLGLAANKYAGTWTGTTSQSLPIAFLVNDSGVVDRFMIRLRLSFVTFTCTGNVYAANPFNLSGDRFSTTVTFPGSNITSSIAGTFSSTTGVAGTFSGYSGGFSLICGSSFVIGTGTPLSSGTWSATKAAPLSATASASATGGQAPVSIKFTGTVSGGAQPYSYSWSFGDGTAAATSQSPSHTFNRGGTFTVRFTVTDAVGNTASATTQVTITPPPPLSLTTSADKSSGQAPLAVHFTASPAGGVQPYTYAWDFGDGSPVGTAKDPTHTYETAGTFKITLTVTDDDKTSLSDNHLSVTVTPAPALTASASTYTTSGEAPLHVSFSANASGGIPPYEYNWDFGDGSAPGTSSYQSHTYSATGTFRVTLVVKDKTKASVTDNHLTITVKMPSDRYGYVIPSIAHAPGTGGTQWRSDIALVNRSSSSASITYTLVPYGSGQTQTLETSLAGGATVEWKDVLVSKFGVAAEASAKGTVHIDSYSPLYVVSRTYNQTDAGTFGQRYPALKEGEGLTSGQTGVLPQLKKNAAYRTNIGVVNLGSEACTTKIRLFNATGAEVGSVTLAPEAGRYLQSDDVFRLSGAGNQDVAYATVEVQTQGCKIWAYASVVDAITGDPTTIPVLVQP